MTGTLSQIIALTGFGNDYLKNDNLPEDFYPGNLTFQFCNTVDFREFKKKFFFLKPKESQIANTPIEWFKYLKNDGCRSLRLYFEYSKDQSFANDHKLAGLVGGGGSWLIEAIYDSYSNYWANRWEVTNQDAPDNKIWTVNYGMTVKKQQKSNLQIDQNKIKERLNKTLTEIAEFAYKQDLENWGKQFESAKNTLNNETPNNSYYNKNLIPTNNYSLTAKQILYSAGSSWVFGGMGSWNDLGFEGKEDNELYDRLSAQLYDDITQAIISATNSY